ncbi:MAG TPA: Asp-tRNA(Asn)/Glu-tRNA(Gln) amidotransferase GatCAB subunit B [Gammaproteobacteria bacterium]|nr:Asp-tRNA(Asn)/Glu-tRNA(Gln) amidotransferase GatCAB subunit B [Gammaproteobacteria bacterium]
MQWESVIGLEVHVQLSTQSKIFSGASTAYGASANSQACAIDLGLPGVLPVLNEEAVNKAIKFGLAIDAQIADRSVFARKNYFYPDLPKGYQISQFELPIVGRGQLTILLENGTKKTIGVTRAHLEEDAGKSIHDKFAQYTGIDLNRAGTPLLEIVSEPDLRSAQEAVAYLKKLHGLVRYLDISDGNMQEGSFRCDANVSVRPQGQAEFGTRAEVKNINSFRFVEKAINFEVERQIDLIEAGGVVVQETRLYDADRDETRSMRSKEEANDYRYFPDPDLLPLEISANQIASIRGTLPELPDAKRIRFQQQYGLSESDAAQITDSKEMADVFEQILSLGSKDAKLVANWLLGEVTAYLNKYSQEVQNAPIDAKLLAGLFIRIEDKTLSIKMAKEVFASIWSGEGTADEIIDAKGLKQVTDVSALEALVTQVLTDNSAQVEQYRAGTTKVLGFLVGQVMKLSKGQANPQMVNQMLKDKLDV